MTKDTSNQNERETLLSHQHDCEEGRVMGNDVNANANGDQDDPSVSKPKQKQHVPTPRKTNWFQGIKYTYSLGLLALCVGAIVLGIAANETPVSQATRPVVALVTMWILIFFLGILEGGQGCLVGLQPIPAESYAATHPTTHQCTRLAHDGDNLNRFIVGRQFLVVLVVFLLNLCCTVVEGAVVPGLPTVVTTVILGSGLAVMLITVMLGQLSAEVNATNCMLDFVNTSIVYVTTWFCLAIETSGLLHAVYLVPYLFYWCSSGTETNKGVETNRTPSERLFFWGRVWFSLSILGYAMWVTLDALMQYETTWFEGLSNNLVSVAIFIALICFLGILEAMQIALFAVVNLPQEDLDAYPVARSNCRLAFSGNNFQAFLIGRQICVTISMFLLARITTTNVDADDGSPTVVAYMGVGVQDFFNTGLPGALITTIVASLAWRIVASCFPIPFMACPVVYSTIRLCLALEASGVFSASWLLADGLKFIMGLRSDEEYLGSMGQRSHHHGPSKDAPEEEHDDELTQASSADSQLDSLSSFGYGSTDN